MYAPLILMQYYLYTSIYVYFQPFTLPGVHTPPGSTLNITLPTYEDKAAHLRALSTPLLRQTLSQHSTYSQQLSPKHNTVRYILRCVTLETHHEQI